jgi:hypothetical protein
VTDSAFYFCSLFPHFYYDVLVVQQGFVVTVLNFVHFYCFVFVFETGSLCVARLASNPKPSCLSLVCAGIVGVHHLAYF